MVPMDTFMKSSRALSQMSETGQRKKGRDRENEVGEEKSGRGQKLMTSLCEENEGTQQCVSFSIF